MTAVICYGYGYSPAIFKSFLMGGVENSLYFTFAKYCFVVHAVISEVNNFLFKA
ncbi:hypothetical protein FIU88_02130 [Halomonas sp. THAF12]|nr:hypothetical protein FIU88_02130 [Halomonas sp. THAF12]